ncbi:MAG: tryptophan synthase subunit alpha [Candidatus Omnitrophota bacterium]
MNRIESTFQKLRLSHKKAFIAFLTAGYPDLTTTEKLVLEFSRRGVDMIELGIPFSDPMADGPVIQESSQAALLHHIRLADVLAMVKRLRCFTQIPLLFMSYYNPIYCMGETRFVREAARAGLDGVIIPDLPPEEGRTLIRIAARAGIDPIMFVAPTTGPKRLLSIAKAARGFIYYVSVAGVTGARANLPADVAGHVRMIQRLTETPVCVGFGVSTPAQVKQIRSVADGVIVGSAIIRTIKEFKGSPCLVDKVGAYVTTLMGKNEKKSV